MSFYCKVCAKMPIGLINESIKEVKEKLVNEKVAESDMKSKVKILKVMIKDLALKANVNLD